MPDDGSSSQAAAWQAAINNVNTNVNAMASATMNKNTREWNEKMYGVQRADALKDWNMQNAYNSPTAQMDRLKSAGLNPFLIYGKGADVTATSMPRASSMPSYNPETPRLGKSEGLDQYFSVQAQSAQIDNLKAQNTYILQQAATSKAQQLAIEANTPGYTADSSRKVGTLDSMIEYWRGNAATPERHNALMASQEDFNNLRNSWYDKTQNMGLQQTAQAILESQARVTTMQSQRDEIQQRITNLKSSNDIMQFEKELNNYGITRNDDVFWRLVSLLIGGTKSATGAQPLLNR